MKGRHSIGEVARIVGVESHTIRFWSMEMGEKIKPVIGKGGRRYYDDSDIKVLNEIKDLIYKKGYTIGMIKKGIPFEASCVVGVADDNFQNKIVAVKNKISYLLKLHEENV